MSVCGEQPQRRGDVAVLSGASLRNALALRELEDDLLVPLAPERVACRSHTIRLSAV